MQYVYLQYVPAKSLVIHGLYPLACHAMQLPVDEAQEAQRHVERRHCAKDLVADRLYQPM